MSQQQLQARKPNLLGQDICEIYSAFIFSAEEFSGASVTVFDGLETTVTLVFLLQASPDVDEEGFSLRPGEEGDDILSVISGSSSQGTLLLQNC